jgi:hypothetical protein
MIYQSKSKNFRIAAMLTKDYRLVGTGGHMTERRTRQPRKSDELVMVSVRLEESLDRWMRVIAAHKRWTVQEVYGHAAAHFCASMSREIPAPPA